MAANQSHLFRHKNVASRWCGDLPVSAYTNAIKLLTGALTSSRGRDGRILSAQRILLERLITPPAGGIGQRLTQFHEYLYDRLSYAHLFKDRKVLDEVVWVLRELREFCSRVEGVDSPGSLGGIA